MWKLTFYQQDVFIEIIATIAEFLPSNKERISSPPHSQVNQVLLTRKEYKIPKGRRIKEQMAIVDLQSAQAPAVATSPWGCALSLGLLAVSAPHSGQ